MEKIIRILTFLLLPALTVILNSCMADKEVDLGVIPNPGEEGTAEVTFYVDVPHTTQVTTRSQAGTVAENYINDIYILVFDKNSEVLISKAKGKNLTVVPGTDSNNKVSFKATLPVGKEYTFMLLANAESQLSGIDVGITPGKTYVTALVIEKSGKWNASSPTIPMWGEKNLTLTASSSPSFELTRMLARVNVEVNLKEISAGVTKDNFKLTSVRYYNYNTAGMLIPGAGNYDFNNNAAVTPTIPPSPGTKIKEALIYDGNDITEEQSCKEKIYVFEAAHNGNTYNNPVNNAAWINNPCLVIGGQYKTESGTWLEETFYRIDFIRKDNTDPNNLKDIWLSILRNFSYNVSITEVSGSGFPDPDTALESAPINMEANVLEWNESDMGEIVFDGVFYLSVSRDKLSVVSSAVTQEKEENLLYIKTDYIYNNNPLDGKSGWYVEKYVDKNTGNPVTWLTLNPDRAAPDANNPVKTWFTFEENNSNAPRTAIVWITAGRLRYPVEVTQNLGWISIIDPNNNNEPLTELRFEVPVGGNTGETKPFKVIWGPAGETVHIEQTTQSGKFPFDPQWLDPVPSPSWTINDPTGSKIYSVKTPIVSPESIAQDPFYEKESTYSFTVGTPPNAETASILLHQIYYNILAELYNPRLDGKVHTMTVRSNTNWEIISVEERLFNELPAKPGSMLKLVNTDNLRVGTTGGPDVAGETLSFTVVNQKEDEHKEKWGTVYVTFRNPDNKFQDYTVIIRFPRRQLTILGLGDITTDRAYNPGAPYPLHNQGANRMLTAEVNFGTLPESTVLTQSFKIYGYHCAGTPRAQGGVDPGLNWYNGALAEWLNKHDPDIIFISREMTIPQTEANLLRQYLDNGGAIIAYYGGDGQNRNYVRLLMNTLMDTNIRDTDADMFVIADEGFVYKLNDMDDPILNGPFENLRGKKFGIHIAHAAINSALIEDQVIPLCKYENLDNRSGHQHAARSNYTSIFRHKTKNLFWIGNGMGLGSYYPGYNHNTYDTMKNDDDYRPQIRYDFGYPGDKRDIHNSFLFLNAVSWAMDVTNHHAPDGYK